MKLVQKPEQELMLVPVDSVTEAFEFWKTIMGHERAQLGPKRRKAIRAAMDMGYTLDDLRLAVVGCKFSPFNQGQNDRNTPFDDIELICRDETKIDRFIRTGEERLRDMAAKQARRDAEDASGPAVPMPAAVRAQLDALFKTFHGKRSNDSATIDRKVEGA